MTYKVPAAVKASRAITINGVTYAKDQVLTAAQLLAIPKLSALLSSGRLYADPDVHARKAVKGGRTPTNLPPVVLESITTDYDAGAGFENQAVSVTLLGHRVTLTVTGGQPPYTVDWGDGGDPEVGGATDPALTHVYETEDDFTIEVTGDEGDTYPTNDVTVAAMTATVTMDGLDAALVFTHARTPISVDWGDGTDPDGLEAHTYAEAGDYTVTVTDQDGFTATDDAAAVAVPGAPTAVAGTDAGTHTASVTWTAPADDGNSAITGYTIEWSSDSFATAPAGSATDPASPYVAAVGAGTWKFRVKATNAVGTGAASTASSNVVVA